MENIFQKQSFNGKLNPFYHHKAFIMENSLVLFLFTNNTCSRFREHSKKVNTVFK